MSGRQALSNTISFWLLLVALLLLPAGAYFASRMSRPLARMRSAALPRAGGDLPVRADDPRPDEFGELGRALNFLSSELGATISSLQLERNRLQSLITGLSEGIIAIGPGGETTLLNPAVGELLHLDVQTGDVRAAAPEVFALFDEALRSGKSARDTLWRGDTALRVSISPLEDAQGEITGCVGIVSDVTSAERLEQTRRDYVAKVSHELRPPLKSIRALMEPLRDGRIQPA